MYGLVDVLAQTNKFRVEDLPENRRGLLTGAQKFRLLRRMLKPVLIFALIGLIFVALFIALAVVDENGYYLRAVLSQSGWRILLIVVMVAALTIAFLWRSSELILDLRDGRVASAEGHVTKTMSFYDKGGAMFYGLGGMKFAVSNQAYNALIEGTTYRIFYTPRSKFLVSIEPTGTPSGEHGISQGRENTAASSTVHAGQFPTRVPRDRNPNLRRGLAWYFGMMLLGLIIGLVVYFLTPSPHSNAVHRPHDETPNARAGTGQK